MLTAAASTARPKRTAIKAKVDTNIKKKKKLLKPEIMRSSRISYNNKENQSELTDEIP